VVRKNHEEGGGSGCVERSGVTLPIVGVCNITDDDDDVVDVAVERG
jgi:hypothetical protein